MPYIPKNRRREINNELTIIGDQFMPQNAGDLNYIVSTFIDNFLVEKGLRYAHINDDRRVRLLQNGIISPHR